MTFVKLSARFLTMLLWTKTLPLEEIQRRYNILFSALRSLGIDPEDRPLTKAMIRLLDGDSDAAVEVLATEYFAAPLAANLDWQHDLISPLFDEARDDARVKDGIAQYQADTDKLREEMREFLSSLDQ